MTEFAPLLPCIRSTGTVSNHPCDTSDALQSLVLSTGLVVIAVREANMHGMAERLFGLHIRLHGANAGWISQPL